MQHLNREKTDTYRPLAEINQRQPSRMPLLKFGPLPIVYRIAQSGFMLLLYAFLSIQVCHGQLALGNIEQLLRRDTNFHLARLIYYTPGNWDAAIAADGGIHTIFGRHYLKARLDDTSRHKQMLVFYDHPRVGGFIFDTFLENDSLEFANMYHTSTVQLFPRFGKPRVAQLGIAGPVTGVAVKSKSNRYTLFIQAGDGTVGFTSMLSDSTIVSDGKNYESLLENKIDKLFLFDSAYSVSAIINYSDSAISVTSFGDKIKQLVVSKEQTKSLAAIDVNYCIYLYRLCELSGTVARKKKVLRTHLFPAMFM